MPLIATLVCAAEQPVRQDTGRPERVREGLEVDPGLARRNIRFCRSQGTKYAPARQDGHVKRALWISDLAVSYAANASASARPSADSNTRSGLHRSLDRLIAKQPALAVKMSVTELAEIAWQMGDHRRAVKYWRTAFAGSEPGTQARRLEREAACLWDRGSYVRANMLARRALTVASQSGDSTAISLCLEMRARVLNHMRRTPDLRWFATARRVARLLDEISDMLHEPALSLHVRTRLRDVAALLGTDPEAFGLANREYPMPPFSSADGAEIFNQYESLSALLDYRRGSQRRERASDGQPIQELWLQTYLAGTRFLGKTAAEKTTPALPGASSYFTLLEAVQSLGSAPATLWHRGRLLGRYLLDRLHFATT